MPVRDLTSAATGPTDALIFVEHKLHDPGLNGMHSHTLLAPEDWDVEGGLIRPHTALFNMPVVMDVKVTGPGGQRARIMPALSFEFDHYASAQPWQPMQSGNLYMPFPESLSQWMLEQAKADPEPGVTDVRVVREEVDEQLTAQLRQQAAPMFEQAQQMQQMSAYAGGIGAVFDTQAQTITFSYTKAGQPFEETYLVCWQAYGTTRYQQVIAGNWNILLMVSVRDNPGVDATRDPVLQAIFQSVRTTPQWQREMDAYWAELARIQQRGAQIAQQEAAKRSQIMRETNEAISGMITDGWNQRQASHDRSHQRFIDTIHEVTPYRTPAGDTVRLPSHYGHAHTDGHGRYLLHNDPGYDPNRDSTLNNQNWQRIERAEY